MSETTSGGRGGCLGTAPAIVAVVGLIIACIGMPWVYFFRDYDYIEGTARRVQDAGVLATQGLAWGLIGLLVLVGLYALAGLALTSAGGWTRWASPSARATYEAIELARAQHQVLPEGLSSMTVTHNHNQRLPAPVAAPAELPSPAEQAVIGTAEAPPALPAPTGGPILAQLKAKGLVTPGSLFVGLGDEAPARIDMQACGFVAVGGRSRSGKSTTTALLLTQAALMGWDVALCDPFPHKPDGLMSLCRPLSGHFFRQAGSPEEIAKTILLVDKIGQRRMAGLDPNDRPVLLVIEEFTNVVIREMLAQDILNLLPAMAMAYAAVGVHGIIIGHDFSRNMLGDDYGATLRRACTHRIAHRMAPDAAELLVPSAAHARQVAELRPGRVLFWGDDSPELVNVPRVEEPDLVFAARGKAPKAYQTPQGRTTKAPAPPSAQVVEAAPAPPAHRSVPETTRLASSVDEWVLEYLQSEGGWHTADAIARGIGANPGTLKNKLKRLADAGNVRSRGPGRGPYEYAAAVAVTA
jgi:hypothetical protein